MQMKEKLTIRQFAVLTFMVMIGDMILIYPTLVTYPGQQDGWICSLLAQPVGCCILWLMFRLYKAYPGKTLIEICYIALGRWIGFVLAICYLFYFLVGAAICIREVGDFLTTQIYLKTPIRAIIILLIASLTWGIFKGLGPIGRSAELLAPFVVMGMLILILALLPQADASNLRPYFGIPWLSFVDGIIRGAFTSYGELIVLSMLFPYIMQGPHLQRDMLTSALFGGILLSMLLLVSLLVLGPMLTQHDIYVSYILAQKIDVGRFFQRIEALMAIAWLISTYFKSMLHIFAFIVGTSQLFKMQDYKPLILPSMLLFFAMGVLIAPNIIFYTLTIMPAWFELDITVSTIIPLFLLLIHRFRRMISGKQPRSEGSYDR